MTERYLKITLQPDWKVYRLSEVSGVASQLSPKDLVCK